MITTSGLTLAQLFTVRRISGGNVLARELRHEPSRSCSSGLSAHCRMIAVDEAAH
jgi:hypothetical protein